MRALLIDPFACQVRNVTLPRGVGPMVVLQRIYQILSHETVQVDSIDGVPLGKADYLLVDGHGLLKDPTRWFQIPVLHHETLAGKGLIIGRRPDGSETDTNYLVADIAYCTVFFATIRGGMRMQTTTPWRLR